MSTKKTAKKAAKKVASTEPKTKGKAAVNKKEEIESRHISELSHVDRNKIEELLRKDPSALSEPDMEHLVSRRAYLTTDERKKFNI